MNDINLFGVNWQRKILKQPELYKESIIAVIEYTNNNGDICYIANDVVNLHCYPDSFGWVIDDDAVLSAIQKACKNNTPIFICFNEEQKKVIEKTIKNSSLNNVKVISALDIFK